MPPACIPIIAQDEALGALWMVRKEAIYEKEVNLLTAIANLSANAIHRVTLFERQNANYNGCHHCIKLTWQSVPSWSEDHFGHFTEECDCSTRCGCCQHFTDPHLGQICCNMQPEWASSPTIFKIQGFH
jgi:hypothetical protein